MFPTVAGFADLRLEGDRYLNLGEERAKASALAAIAPMLDLAGLASAYYARTGDVDPRRRARYLAHIARAESRGAALAALLPRQGRILEVGCGTGGLLVAARRSGLAIEGVDIAARWLVLARKRLDAAALSVRLTAAEASRLPWPDATFACVVADSLIEHLDDPSAALAEWLRVVRPGGRLVLWSPNRRSILPDPHVGLWGLGWQPRRLQPLYVKARRKTSWPIRVRSPREAIGLATAAGWEGVRVDPAALRLDSSRYGSMISGAYNRARVLPIASSLLRSIGPLWQLRAIRGGAS